MTFIDKLVFYMFIFYPAIGYFTFTYFNFPPFYVVSFFVMISFFFKFFNRLKFKFPRYIFFYMLYMFSVIFSKYLIYQIPLRLDSNLSSIVLIFLAFIIFLVIENTKIPDSFIKNSRKLMTYFIYAAALVSIIQYFRPLFFIYTEEYTLDYDLSYLGYARRILSIFTWGEFSSSQYLAIGFVIIYGICIYENRNNKLLSILLPIFAGIVVILSQLRIAMLTYLIATFLLVFNKLSLKVIFYTIFFIFSFYMIVDILDFNFTFFIENRIKSDSALTRIAAFKAFFYAFPKNPFFGTGGARTEALFKGYGHVARLHNFHLAIAYFYGIFAFIFHTLFLIFLMKKNYKTGKQAKYWPPFVGMLCYMSASMTMPNAKFFNPGLIFMMVFNKYYFDHYQLRKRSQL